MTQICLMNVCKLLQIFFKGQRIINGDLKVNTTQHKRSQSLGKNKINVWNGLYFNCSKCTFHLISCIFTFIYFFNWLLSNLAEKFLLTPLLFSIFYHFRHAQRSLSFRLLCFLSYVSSVNFVFWFHISSFTRSFLQTSILWPIY